MLKRVLVVDDVAMNRDLLAAMLGADYEVLEAADGKEALAVLRANEGEIAAVLLDIVMPVMDGYATLEAMKADEELCQIPVIAITGNDESESEIKALTLGAADFIAKPYNVPIVRQRLSNIIELRETAAIANAAMRDKLTGLYNREAFFEKAAGMIVAHEPGYYIIACFDINNFKVINDQYGTAKGDEVLRTVGGIFYDGFTRAHGIIGRLSNDDFVVLYPATLAESGKLEKMRRDASVLDGSIQPLSLCIGRYVINDLELPVSAMYDRALLAMEAAKGRDGIQIAWYEESMRERVLREQEIVDDMKPALEQGQFEIWLQPQFNHATKALVGAEALVRWRHPTKGLIPPGEFIPVFERTGFIYQMDQCIWEQACVLLRQWIDERIEPLPISVNVSRFDMFQEGFFDTLCSMPIKHGIPIDLLRIEITESAFADSTDHIVDMADKLMNFGFTVEIDDFGSGYSSLNTLKDVAAQILKLDMRFLEDSRDTQRGGNIIESIVRMAKWLGMPVIAEGVERIEQADYLKSIGCFYIQGYLYAKPMTAEDYKELIVTGSKEGKLLALETIENLNNNAFWDPDSMDTLIFNSYVGGACIFEYHNGYIELLRASDKYAQVIGSAGLTTEEALKIRWEDHIDAKGIAAVAAAVEHSRNTGEEVTSEFLFRDLPGCPRETFLRSTIRVIAKTQDSSLVYCINENITQQREAERIAFATTERLQIIMDHVGCGITAVVTDGDFHRFLFANDKYFELLGYTRQQFRDEINDPLAPIHPLDREAVLEKTRMVEWTGMSDTVVFRAIKRNGSEIWLRVALTLTSFNNVEEPVQIGIYDDITNERLAVEALQESEATIFRNQEYLDILDRSLPLATFILRLSDGAMIHMGGTLVGDLGYTNEEFAAFHDNYLRGFVYEKDFGTAFKELRLDKDLRHSNIEQEFRVVKKDGSLSWVFEKASYIEIENEPSYIVVLVDISGRKDVEQRLHISEEKYRVAAAKSSVAFARYDIKSDVFINDAEEFMQQGFPKEIHGLPQALIDAGLVARESIDDIKRFFDEIRLGIDGAEATLSLYAEGKFRSYQSAASIVVDDDGAPSLALIAFFDVARMHDQKQE